MDQCSRHDIPPAVRLPTNRRGHALALVLVALYSRVVTRRRFGLSMLLRAAGPVPLVVANLPLSAAHRPGIFGE